MRKVVLSMSVSLDGYFESEDRKLDWVVIDEEYHGYMNNLVEGMSALLYGRKMYDLMAEYWPTAENDTSLPGYMAEFARIWIKIPKIVFSRSLKNAGWNTKLVREGIKDEILKLKAQPGGDLGLGGAEIGSAFFKLGLIDEYRLSIHPVILGRGYPLFKNFDDRTKLELLNTRTFKSGVIELHYQVGK